jgi:hypothetical protein
VAWCAAARDPSWGIYGQRLDIIPPGQGVSDVHAMGLKTMAYYEGFGTGSSYVAQFKKNPNGSWVKFPQAPDVTQTFRTHWDWQFYDGTGEIHWVGPQNYFDDEDFARPYTRTHPRYGSPPMTYPDGTTATGYNGPSTDPRNSRIFDACASKNVLGDLGLNPNLNAKFPDISCNPIVNQQGGPFDGLIQVGSMWCGLIWPPKDSACPSWIDYARASALQAADAGIDAFWVDNYSAWDSFNLQPITKAFGEWSIAGFRSYLAAHFLPADLAAMGVGNPATFDVRGYLRNTVVTWGGVPTNLNDPYWLDSQWLDDPVWRAYKIYKRQTGTAALASYYRSVKEAAAATGKPDLLVAGNDIPLVSLGWPRGDLDMVATELDWGPGWTTGPRGLMPPPLGSYVPVYQLAREHARSRFVNVFMNVPNAQLHKAGIANVLLYQGLSNHAFPMPQPGGNVTAGDDGTNAAFFGFARSVRATFGARVPAQEIGVYYSSSSQLAALTPNGFIDQPHSFAHWGWGTALVWLHYQYRAVPEWKLSSETLAPLRVFVIPDAEVFDQGDVPVVEAWVQAGGRLIVTGNSGRRRGEAGNLDVRPEGLSLAPLTGVSDVTTAPAQQLTTLGAGAVLYLKDNIGMAFYNADVTRPALLAGFQDAITTVTAGQPPFLIADAAGVGPTVGLTVYDDAGAQRRFVDVNNVDVNTATDTIAAAPPLSFTLALPSWLQGRPLTPRVLSPDGAVGATIERVSVDRIRISVSSVPLYSSVVLEASPLVAAVLPSSRSVQVGTAATVFATVINTGTAPASGVGVGLATSIPAVLDYQTTDPLTNALTGTSNVPVDIASGKSQTYVIAITPIAAFAPTDVAFTFAGTNADPAPTLPGIDTLLLSASPTPVPDIVALAATANNNGIVVIPGPSGSGAFAVATVNVGASASITASADTGNTTLPVSVSVCQTNPVTGQCLSAPGPTVTTLISANDTPTFAVFAQGSATIPFDPANNRIFVRFKDAAGVTRGATSVAVRTQ